MSEEEKAVYREYLPDPRKMPVAKKLSVHNALDTAPAGTGGIEVVDDDLADPDVATDSGIADGDLRDGHRRETTGDTVVGVDGMPLAPIQYNKKPLDGV